MSMCLLCSASFEMEISSWKNTDRGKWPKWEIQQPNRTHSNYGSLSYEMKSSINLLIPSKFPSYENSWTSFALNTKSYFIHEYRCNRMWRCGKKKVLSRVECNAKSESSLSKPVFFHSWLWVREKTGRLQIEIKKRHTDDTANFCLFYAWGGHEKVKNWRWKVKNVQKQKFRIEFGCILYEQGSRREIEKACQSQ